MQSILFGTIITNEGHAYTFSRGVYLVFGEFDNSARVRIQNRLREELNDLACQENIGDPDHYTAVFESILKTEGFSFCALEDGEPLPACDGFFPVYAILWFYIPKPVRFSGLSRKCNASTRRGMGNAELHT